MNRPSPDTETLTTLLARAREAVAAGRYVDAARNWQSILAIESGHAESLSGLGTQALAQRDGAAARHWLQRAVAATPGNPMLHVSLGLASRLLGDDAAEMDSLTRALTLDPYCFSAHLHVASRHERRGETRLAAKSFERAMKIASPAVQDSAGYESVFAHARVVLAADRAALAEFLRDRISAIRERFRGEKLERFDESLDVLAGVKRRYRPEPITFTFPQLPPIQFFDRSWFPWLTRLEASTGEIRDEVLTVMREELPEFKPYVAYRPGEPVNQWQELNHSSRWSSYFLWRSGRRIDEHCQRCPRTTAMLASLPTAELPNYGPTAMFSVLSPRTVIPPHTGETNVRLVVHLPLIVPEGCYFRVGNDTRKVIQGQAWAFDDTFEHEARNDSEVQRTILIFDVWNPLLSKAEQELVGALLNAHWDYYHESA